MSLVSVIQADLVANKGDGRSQYIMVLFRCCSELTQHGKLIKMLSMPLRLIYRFTVISLLCVEIPVGTSIGPGLRLLHAYGLVVHHGTIIGANCVLKHGCTLGVRTGPSRPSGNIPPCLGDNVDLGPGAQVLGPVTLGNNATIGAGAIVLIDVPMGRVAVGNPARLIM